MRRLRRVVLFTVAVFTSGVLLGAGVTAHLILVEGESVGARIIQAGVRLANSGSTPLWEVQIRPEPVTPPTARPVAQKGAAR